jgi:enoyl-CoA hydratase
VFCAGADRAVLANISADPSSDDSYRDLLTIYQAFARTERLAVPTITAMQGTALCVGFNLAMSSDICLVADDARLVGGFLLSACIQAVAAAR